MKAPSFFYSRMGLAIIAAAFVSAASYAITADEVAYDDFEDQVLGPFDEALGEGDGTDWTNVIPGWTIENTVDHVATEAAAYNGWTAMDVDSWIGEQGVQAGRDRMRLETDNNTALVADPDAWDDILRPARV